MRICTTETIQQVLKESVNDMRMIMCLLILPLCGCLSTPSHPLETNAPLNVPQKGCIQGDFSAFAQLIQENDHYTLRILCSRLSMQRQNVGECEATERIFIPDIQFKGEGPLTSPAISPGDAVRVVVKGDAKQVDGQMQVHCSFQMVEGNTTWAFQGQTLIAGEQKVIQLKKMTL